MNYDTLRRLINLNLLPISVEYVLNLRMNIPPFNFVDRVTEPLDLIHSDICDLKFVQTRGGKSIL